MADSRQKRPNGPVLLAPTYFSQQHVAMYFISPTRGIKVNTKCVCTSSLTGVVSLSLMEQDGPPVLVPELRPDWVTPQGGPSGAHTDPYALIGFPAAY